MPTISTTITPPSNAQYSTSSFPHSPYTVYIEYSYSVNQDTAVYTINHALKLRQDTNSWDFDTVASVYAGYWVTNWGTGTEYYKNQRINIDDKGNNGYTITLASGTSYVQANKTTGEAFFYVGLNFSINSGGYGPGKIYKADTRIDLPTLDRDVPTCYCTLSNITSSGFTVTASSDWPCTDYWYQIYGDPTWYVIASDQTYYTYSKSKTHSIGQGPHSVRTCVRRSWNNIDGYSGWVDFNNSLPVITINSLQAISNSQSKVNFHVNYPCKYAITNSTSKPSMSSTIAADTGTNVTYNITSNSSNTRYLHVVKDNSYGANLHTYIALTTDNVLPTITLTTPQVSGNQVTISATSNVACDDWSIQYRKKGTTSWNDIGLLGPVQTSSLNFVLGDDISEQLEMNVDYEYQIFARKVSNNLYGYSTIGTFKCLGTGMIYISNKAELATAYIYNGNKYKSAVPYIYTDNQWKQTY